MKRIPVFFQRWATMSEVSEALGVTRHTIKHAVQKAHALGHAWVKRDPNPTPGCFARWLIDTSHPTYHSHEQRWRKAEEDGEGWPPLEELLDQASKERGEGSETTFDPLIDLHDDPHERWPERCSWLEEQGLIISPNVLSEDACWMWSWRGAFGTGYDTACEATIAALQHQMQFGEPLLKPVV